MSNGKQTKYQKFDMDTVQRDEIKGAEYNPRVISEDAKKRLRKMLAKHGLVQPLVWNRRTGNLVSGHQRLAALDSLERSQDYALQVAVVDLNERDERILNVQLNNPSMMGEWDMDKLSDMAEQSDIAPSELGFSDGDIAVMFGDGGSMDELLGDCEGVKEAKTTLQDIKQHRAEGIAKMQAESNADFYFTVVCESDEQKKAIMKELGVPTWEAFVNGKALAGKLSI